MSDNSHSSGIGSGGARSLFRSRTLGIALMLLSVVAFVISLLVYPDQVLCFFGSTLVTFAGLAIYLSARRPAGNQPAVQPPAARPAPPHRSARQSSAPLFARQVPRGLREAARRQPVSSPLPDEAAPPTEPLRPVYAPPPEAPEPELASEDSAAVLDPDSLLGRVAAWLEEQGAQVTVESQREDRGILNLRAPGGQIYIVLVRKSQQPAEVSDVRALFALVSSSGSDGGYLVSSAPFTQPAYDYAAARRLLLIEEEALDTMRI